MGTWERRLNLECDRFSEFINMVLQVIVNFIDFFWPSTSLLRAAHGKYLVSPFRFVVHLRDQGVYTDVTVVKDAWFHLTLIWKQPQNQTHLFVNEDKYSNYVIYNGSFDPPAGGAMVIGRKNTNINNHYSSLSVDEVAIWNVVLPDDDVKLIARSPDE